MPNAKRLNGATPEDISRVMAILGAIKTKKKAASSSKNLAKARKTRWKKRILTRTTR